MIKVFEKMIEDEQMMHEDHMAQLIVGHETIRDAAEKAQEQADLIETLESVKNDNKAEIANYYTRNQALMNDVAEAGAATDAAKEEIAKLTDDLEEVKFACEEKVSEMKNQLNELRDSNEANANAAEDAAAARKKSAEARRQQESDRKAADAEAAKHSAASLPKEFAQTQTDIGMEYFDRERSFHDQESRRSNASQSNKQRVGGGGSIVKPPRNPSRQTSSKGEIGAGLNVTGMTAKPPSDAGSRASSKKGSQQALPHLMKNAS